jgi:peptidoglycan/LPS O-acetylase OafA/YrhL
MSSTIKGLDGIRGLSALSVVLTHLHAFVLLENLGILSKRITPMINGTAGVQAFFILSGFLITSLLIAEIRKTNTVSLKNFFMRRALRIFPLYYLFLIISTVIYALDNRVTSPNSLMFAYAYIYNFVPKSVYTSFLGHTWSLAVEEHFYLLWPFLFLCLYQARKSTVLFLLIACIPGSLVVHLAFLASKSFSGFFVERWSFIAGYSIVSGCILAIVLNSPETFSRARTFLGQRSALMLGAAIYCFPAALLDISWTFDNILSHYFRCFGLLCLIGWVALNQESLVVYNLERKPLQYLGKISYGIYMYQGLFLATGPFRHEGHLWPPTVFIGILALIIVVPISYHFFEQPFINLKRKFQSYRKE